MAPKRQRGNTESSSSASRAYDKKKFTDITAADKFHHVLAERPLVPERGLHPNTTDGDLQDMIIARGWETFTLHPDPACTAIVKEFYANAQDTPECQVWVRGEIVTFSRTAINAYYNLQAPDPCQFATLKPDHNLIIQQLAQPGTEWIRNKHTGRVKSFPGKCLSRYGKIWYAFIGAKLMPCTHFSDVTVDRSTLLYAIVTDLKIDVGGIIEASIKRNLQGSTSGGLPHPSLITELCRQAGVKWGAAEPLFPPTTLLDHQLIRRYHAWPGGVSHPKGLGFIIAPPPPTEEVPPAADAPSTSTSTDNRRMRRLERRMDSLDDQLTRLALRQGETHIYNTRFNTALVSYLQRLNPTVELGSFPVPQALSEFPPPTEDDDDSAEYSEDEDEDDELDASDT